MNPCMVRFIVYALEMSNIFLGSICVPVDSLGHK
jgi:hypothetical protein